MLSHSPSTLNLFKAACLRFLTSTFLSPNLQFYFRYQHSLSSGSILFCTKRRSSESRSYCRAWRGGDNGRPAVSIVRLTSALRNSIFWVTFCYSNCFLRLRLIDYSFVSPPFYAIGVLVCFTDSLQMFIFSVSVPIRFLNKCELIIKKCNYVGTM